MNHVAEGVGVYVSSEIEHMFNIEMAGQGMIFVHATDVSLEQINQEWVHLTPILLVFLHTHLEITSYFQRLKMIW